MPSRTQSPRRINPQRKAKRASKQKSKPTLIDTLELSPSLRAKPWSPEPSETDEATNNDIRQWLLAYGIKEDEVTDDEVLCQAAGKEVDENLVDVHVEEREKVTGDVDSFKSSKGLPQPAAADILQASEDPTHSNEQIPSPEASSVKPPKNRWSKRKRREAKRLRDMTTYERSCQ
ncbi:hypothetical protein LIA77_10403 [Sarocladium implicatum]|nr:hypothetical protein LIA77_10403 [Sarocladium implicatum]